jgi:hypothetical protein
MYRNRKYHQGMARRLLERDQELATLLDAASVAAKGTGSVILLHGEAGIGKTSRVSAIRSQLPDGTRMLVGACDALSTPRTLGPFRDLTAAVGPRLAQALQAGERDLVMDALLDELQRPPPSTLVVEDVHWADEATVDTLRFLGTPDHTAAGRPTAHLPRRRTLARSPVDRAASPSMGQGVALAVEDALVLAETLSSLPVDDALPA